MKLGAALQLGVLVAVGLTVVGCGGGAKPATPQCVHNSDCANPLVCALGYCVTQCNSSSDCPNNERCVEVRATSADSGTSTADAGVAEGTACQAPELATCNYTSMCTAPLHCGDDHQCRDQCETNVDCPMGQVCTSSSKLCADPSIDKDYNSTINDFVVNDAGMGIPQGGSNGSGTGGSGTAGHGGGGTGGHAGVGGSGTGGAAGSAVNPCQSPQTSFGNIAQGQANPAFTSGIGVRDGNQLFVFSGDITPPSDGGTAGGNYIYVQAFDSTTADSKGAAAPLFKAADGQSFYIFDASVAPTGEIVLLIGGGSTGTTTPLQLFAAFLDSPTSADAGVPDGGVAGLRANQPIQIESVQFGEPHVVWSVAKQAFVLSWKYYTSDWFTRIRNFSPSGRSVGGDTYPVPTRTGSNNGSGTDDGQVGTSGNLRGSAYRDDVNGLPYLTILDTDGIQVGSLLQLSSTVASFVSTGGTTKGFVSVFNISGATVDGVFVPITGAGSVLTDGGTTVDAGGDAGVAKLFTDFSLTSTATSAKMVSDDTGGQGGVGMVLLESNGASFIYVTADGSKRLTGGGLSSAHGAQIGLSNYLGSFAMSLYDSTTHATQVVASGCN